MNKFDHTPNRLDSQQSSSWLRYFKARFKPYKRPLFWGSAGMLALLAVCIWQYWQHPEWLISTTEQPETLDSLPTVPENSPTNGISLEPGGENLSLPETVAGNGDQDSPSGQTNSQTLLEQLLANQEQQTESTFTDPDLVGSGEDLIDRFSPKNSRLFKENAENSRVSASNLDTDNVSTNEYFSIDKLLNFKLSPVKSNPLENAVDQVMSGSSTQTTPNSNETTTTSEETASADSSQSASNNSGSPESENSQRRIDYSQYSIGTTGYDIYGTNSVDPYANNPNNTLNNLPGSNLPATPNQYGGAATPNQSSQQGTNGYSFNNSFTPDYGQAPNQFGEQNSNNNAPLPSNQYEQNIQSPSIQEPIRVNESPLFP